MGPLHPQSYVQLMHRGFGKLSGSSCPLSFSFSAALQHVEVQGQGSDPSRSCHLSPTPQQQQHQSFNPLCHRELNQRCRVATNPAEPQQELLVSFSLNPLCTPWPDLTENKMVGLQKPTQSRAAAVQQQLQKACGHTRAGGINNKVCRGPLASRSLSLSMDKRPNA